MGPFVLIIAVIIFGVVIYRFTSSRSKLPDNYPIDLTDEDYIAFKDSVSVPAPPPVIHYEPEQTVPDMAQFNIAYNVTRRHEVSPRASYQIIPQDRGNRNSLGVLVGTNWGINAQVYERHLGRPPTKRDMQDMPESVAMSIFKTLYWDKIDGDSIKDQQLATIYYDGHVNHGFYGIKMMQEAAGVAQDGRPGPITLNAINSANPISLFNRYRDIRRNRYLGIIRNDPSQAVFRNGWLARIDSFFYRTSPGGANGALATLAVLAGIAVYLAKS